MTVYTQSEDQTITIYRGQHKLIVDPIRGARILSYQYNNQELLIQPEEHSEFYGSTLWPSPQSVWNWPPPKALDKMPYTTQKISNGYIFTSEKDSITGLIFEKKVKLDEKGAVLLTYKAYNRGKTSIKTALWEVNRVKGGLTFFPFDTEKPEADSLSNLTSVKLENDVLWYRFNKNLVNNKAQKLFANGKEGWLAHIENGMCFLKIFDDVKKNEIPPQQGEIELYVNDKATYIEIENHSSYVLLSSEDSHSYQMQWYYLPVPKHLDSDNTDPEFMKWIKSIVKNMKDK
ncbi:DUF4380 domain-containing protein [Aquimarina celericrescens]|uniref:DUF4380 domain-containing protein n=1 Tax=Aquimarina celericrescens TaxID=1964542 RepID=A0ABW5AZK9_9FLAO|nr:DUF4380 domain-containing protein [Aquimarina celericrescens]